MSSVWTARVDQRGSDTGIGGGMFGIRQRPFYKGGAAWSLTLAPSPTPGSQSQQGRLPSALQGSGCAQSLFLLGHRMWGLPLRPHWAWPKSDQKPGQPM